MTLRPRFGLVRHDVLVLLLLPIIFFLSANFFFQFYRYVFNSDSAFNLILATAVLDERNPFPKDVWFSHDVYLLRPHLVIAFFRLLGLRGLSLYAIACSTVITGCVFAVYCALRWVSRLAVLPALVVAVFVFMPFGEEEYEYILGQQSHILQVTLSLIGFLACIELTRKYNGLAFGLALASTFLLCWDSPLRGCLFVAGTLAILAPGAIRATSIRVVGLAVLGTACLGTLANVWVKSVISIEGVAYYMTIPSTDGAVARLGRQVAQYFALFAGMDDLAGLPLTPLSLSMLAAKCVLAFTIIWAAVFLTAQCIRCLAHGQPTAPSARLAAAGVLTIGAACLVVSFSGLTLDIRHYLPGLIAVKAAALLYLDEYRSWLTRVLLALAIPFAVIGSSITPGFVLTQTPGYYDRLGESAALTKAIVAIIAEKHWPMPVNLYATYWNSSVMEVLLDGRIEAAPISVEGRTIRILKWMSRPSRYCRAIPSLLLVKSDQPILKAIALANGASLLKATRFHEIYFVPPDVVADCRPNVHLPEPTGDSAE